MNKLCLFACLIFVGQLSFAQTFDQSETDKLKDFLSLPSSAEGKNNAEVLRIGDLDDPSNWTGVKWENTKKNKRAVSINWSPEFMNPNMLALADFDGDGKDDMFVSSPSGPEGTGWYVSFGATGSWIKINGSGAALSEIKIGDFNADGKADILFPTEDGFAGEGWYISYGGTSNWEKVNSLFFPCERITLGDFNADGATDVLVPQANGAGSGWFVSWNGTSDLEKINNSGIEVDEILIGDLNGDKKDDILFPKENGFAGTGMYVSYQGTTAWDKINSFDQQVGQIELVDVNGDGTDDILYPTGKGAELATGWYVSYSGTEAYTMLNTSGVERHRMVLGDIDGNSKTDILFPTYQGFAGAGWYVSNDVEGNWNLINTDIFFDHERLAGELDISSFSALSELYIEDHDLSGLVLGEGKEPSSVHCELNKLKISTLPNIDTELYDYTYAPQQKLPIGQKSGEDTYVLDKVDLSTELEVSGSKTVFTWKDNEGNIIDPNETSGVFSFGNDLLGKSVYCEMRNEQFDGLDKKPIQTVNAIVADKTGLITLSVPKQTQNASIDTELRTITIFPTVGTDVTKLKPEIVVMAGATVTPANGIEQDFSSPVSYTITTVNGDSYVWQVKVHKSILQTFDQREVDQLKEFLSMSSGVAGKNNAEVLGIVDLDNPSSWTGVRWEDVIKDRRVVSIDWRPEFMNPNMLALADFDGDGKDDMFVSSSNGPQGTGWYVSYGAIGSWKKINASGVALSEIRIGDFNADGKADILFPKEDGFAGKGWYISYGGTGNWEKVNSLFFPCERIALGDFNADGATDILVPQAYGAGSGWFVSWNGTSDLEKINNSGIEVDEILIGDLNGDKKDDILFPKENGLAGTGMYVSYQGTTAWEKINSFDQQVGQIELADVNGDKKADILFPTTDGSEGTGWYVSYSGTDAYSKLNSSGLKLHQMVLGDIDGNSKLDVVFPTYQGFSGAGWYASYDVVGDWTHINTDIFYEHERLAGTFDGISFASLSELHVEDHDLSGLVIPAGEVLKYVHCELNKLKLSTLPDPKTDLQNFTYTPQQKVSIGQKGGGNNYILAEIDLSAELEFSGEETEFTWKDSENNVLNLDGVDGVFSFGEDLLGKTVYCEMRNGRLGDLEEKPILTVNAVVLDKTGLVAFSIPEQAQSTTIDTETRTITIFPRAGTDITKLTPEILLVAEASVMPRSGSEQDFSSPVSYTITTPNGDSYVWEVKIQTLNIDRIDSNTQELIDVIVYPNPVKDYITIDLSKKNLKISDVSLTDLAGKVVYCKDICGQNNERIDVKTLTKGVYILSFFAGRKKLYKKILIE